MRSLIRLVIILIFSGFTTICEAQSWFWVAFRDKAGSRYSISKPEEYLSEKSILRRQKQAIPIDESDLPVSRIYTDSIIKSGAVLVHKSKWLNGITVKADNDSLAAVWQKFDFVSDVQLSKPDKPALKSASIGKFIENTQNASIDSAFYGASVQQVSMLNAQFFHQQGFHGEGIVIASFDAGFYDANRVPALQHLFSTGKILGAIDFVNPNSDIYKEDAHGMMVVSTMGSYLAGELIGTAPQASYWFFRTEDVATEYPIEEDNWVAAAEYADSAGVDIITASVGYFEFDDAAMNHTYADLDGKTTRVSRGANMAAGKGMLVFTGAGNEAQSKWKRIIAPADAENVIAVAAVRSDSVRSPFSSVGPSFDGRVKPNLAAMGSRVALQGISWDVVEGYGTSYATPLLAGATACLWQANPNATAKEIFNAIMLAGHQSQNPDSLLGYGIPDMKLAHNLLNETNVQITENPIHWKVFPNPFQTAISIYSPNISTGNITIILTSISGANLVKIDLESGQNITFQQFSHLPPGLYFLTITGNGISETHKILKTR